MHKLSNDVVELSFDELDRINSGMMDFPQSPVPHTDPIVMPTGHGPIIPPHLPFPIGPSPL
jgi:hypothetical protein